MKTVKMSAFYLAESINLKEFSLHYPAKVINSLNTEIFFLTENNGYLYLFNYGGVVFYNFTEEEINQTLKLIGNYCLFPLENKIREDFHIKEQNHSPLTVDFEVITVPHIKEDIIKVTMLNLVYSVALDFYSQSADSTLNELKNYTYEMEKKGKVKTSKKNMLKFIGKTLNNKNRIIENLYIFDFPDIVWDNEELDKINRELRKLFNLRLRFKEIEYTYKIIEDNLNIFNQFKFHGESNKLEWIIIFLILIEVIHLLFTQLIK